MTIKTRNIADSAVTTAKIAANAVTQAKLTATMATGFHDIPLAAWRITNAANTDVALVAATALIGSGGVGGIDAEPSLIRVNAATDKQTKLEWIDAKLDPIWYQFTLPPDLDETAAITFKCLASMSGVNDLTSILTLTYQEVGVGVYAADTPFSGATAAIATANPVLYSVSITAGFVGAPPRSAVIDLTPTSPGTDTMRLWATWLEYTKV